jgi:hypothetical protein
MLTIKPRERISRARSATVLLAMTVTACVSSLPAHAFTCEDVRGLSKAQQDYWSKTLNLTGPQRHRIWAACYRDYRKSNPTREALAVRQAR